MHKIIQTVVLSVLAILLVQYHAVAATPAGKITQLQGEVRAIPAQGRSRALELKSIVYAGDRIVTNTGAAVTMHFLDGTRFTLGPDAEMVVEDYSDSEYAEANDSFTTRVLKGAFRFVSGLIAKRKPQSMNVKLTVATIGIRGTHVTGEVIPRETGEDGTVIRESSATVVLMEPEEDRATAIEVANAYGEVTIDQPGYGTEIPDEHSPPSPVRKMQIRTINNVLRALRSTGRTINTPRPRIP